ncbi:MAG: hypothetical protein H8D80_01890 [Proteobacteria bacterium]|nr:hypothetical protein [Pseudomonadota bacterium]
MKTFKHLIESLPLGPPTAPPIHVQSHMNSDGRFIKVMSDGSKVPYSYNDTYGQLRTEFNTQIKETITNIIKDGVPWYAKGFVQADLDNWHHIMQILGNWGKGDGEANGYYLPVKYLEKAKKELQNVIDGGEFHPDINVNSWILEYLQNLHDDVMVIP